MTEQQKDHLETLPDRVRIRRLEISHQAGLECRIESDEQIEKLKKRIRKLEKGAGKSKVAKTDIRAGKIEELLERCYSARTDWEKDSKRVGAYGQEPLNDFDYGECKGWINAMEFVIFNLELIMKEEV